MGRVEDHRIAGRLHRGQAPEIADQRVVAEGRAPVAEQDALVAGAGDLGGHVRHVPGCEELALLDVDGPARAPGGQQKVGLPRQEGGDLEHVADLARRRAMPGLVHVGQDGAAEFGADQVKNAKPLVHAETPRGPERGAVGLVIARLEDEPRAGRRTGLRDAGGHHPGMVKTFELARPGDEGEGFGPTDRNARYVDHLGFDGVHGSGS